MSDTTKTELVKDAEGKTRLVQTQGSNMTAPESSAKVKIRAVQTIRWGKAGQEMSASPGQEVEVDEDVAQEFCDRKFRANYSFGGERGNATAERHVITRAVRL